MSNASPTRHILSNLDVNTSGMPSSSVRSIGKDITSLKRGISAVDDPEFSPAPLRVRSEFHSAQTKLSAQNSSRLNMPGSSSGDPATKMPSEIPDIAHGMSDSSSQHSNRDSTTSSMDSDVEGDTLASQLTAATEMTLPLQSAAAMQAENLRLRLRVALFKVQTNQTSIPMSQLQITSPRNRVQDSPLRSSSQILQSVSPQTREKAPHPRLLPAPVLKPTAYSARNITQTHVPSSPPYSTNSSPESAVGEVVFRTPALPRSTIYEATQMSSPPGSAGSDGIQAGRKQESRESLSSSAIRGKAAIGLLGLREAGH